MQRQQHISALLTGAYHNWEGAPASQWQHRGYRPSFGTHPLLTYRFALILLIGCLLTVGLARPAHATDFRGGDTVVVGENEVIDDDLFVSGETITVNGTVKGNLFASGATVTVNGHVEGSLFMAGRTLALNGPVDGSAYVGGYALTMGEAATIGRNLNFGGYSLTTEAGSTIGRSLYGGGYQLLLNGQIDQDVNVGAGALEVKGTIGGDLRGSVGSSEESTPTFFMPQFEGAVAAVPPGLRISSDARIEGVVAMETVTAATSAPPAPFYSLANAQSRWAIGECLALLIVGLLFLYIRPTFLRQTSATGRDHWLPSLGVGLLIIVGVVIATPLAIGLLVLLTLFGGWLTLGQLVGDILGLGITTLAATLALFFFVATMVTKIIIAYLGGTLLLRNVAATTERSTAREIMALVIGVLIYVGLRLLPFGVGALIGFLVTLLGLGAIYFSLRGTPQPRLTEASPPTVQMTEVHA